MNYITNLTVKELQKLAKKYKISGRSKMNKKQLQLALYDDAKNFKEGLSKFQNEIGLYKEIIKDLNNQKNKKGWISAVETMFPGEYQIDHRFSDDGIKSNCDGKGKAVCDAYIKYGLWN